ncbi:putative Adenosine kinase 2 [Paratrimastix pyriformis]|uniref:Adenosine kinase n=1 Tax=Paratrimastix pyriformis TaxID=342808 RepID=A0ABQ8UGW6_9EUKA|nr:putative Adenosine kinase 2 [Paratrimastix pyriformis]
MSAAVPRGSILGLGNPLLDVSAVVDQAFVDKHQIPMGQQILAEPKHDAMYTEMAERYTLAETPGGACQNAIRAAQRVLGTPQATAYMGCVGNDAFGTRQRELCSRAGVEVNYMVHPTAPTGVCAACVLGHERALIARIAAAGQFNVSHMQLPEAQAMLKRAKVMYVEGFFLMVSMDAIRMMAAECAESTRKGVRKSFCLNLSAAFCINGDYDKIQELMPRIDILFSNDDEARVYAKRAGWEETDVAAIAERIARLPKEDSAHPRLVIFTQGTQPTVVASGAAPTRTFAIVPVPKEELVDTNGAGDSFVGGFLAHYVRDEALEACVQAGHELAAIKVRHQGCVWD